MKAHLKGIAAPKTWAIQKKKNKFVTKQKPGAHSLDASMPLNIVLRDLIGLAKSTKEVKYMLTNKEILVDGKKRKSLKFGIGLMDVLSVPELKKHYRAILTRRNKLILSPISHDEAQLKLCKITGKTVINKKTQLNLGDSRNILLDKTEYKTGDSLIIRIPSQEITKHLPMKEGCMVYLVSGDHLGNVGALQRLKGKNALVDIEGKTFETPKKCLFVIGDTKPAIDISWSRV